MRIVIVVLIMLFGIFADYFTNKIMFREKQLEVVGIHGSVINVSKEILTDLLVQMQLFKKEALRSKDSDRDVINMYDKAIDHASDLVDTFSNIENMSKENINDGDDK